MEIRLRYPNFENSWDALAAAHLEIELREETRRDFDLPTSLVGAFLYFREYPKIHGRKPQVVFAGYGGGVIGQAIFSIKEPELSLHSLYVKENSRGLGIGKRLIEHLVKEAQYKNATTLYVASSSQAIEFYRKFGFRESNEKGRKNEMRLDLIGRQVH